jgi:GntR family transcriptional regulator
LRTAEHAMRLRIDPHNADPIFEQIVFQVKGAVSRSEVAVGQRLPSVRELARELAINPNTVARAYEQLEGQGVIVRRQGAGCFIAERDSKLHDKERERRLTRLVDHTVTEAFHLGFDADEIERAVDRRLRELRSPTRKHA